MLLNGPILTNILGLRDYLLDGAVAKAANHLSVGLQLVSGLVARAEDPRSKSSISYITL